MNTFDLFSMKGKNVLITGGRQMYGLGCTMALADAGANLYLASHSIESAQAFVDQLKEEKGIKVQAVAFDQGDIGSIEQMFKAVIEDGGSLDAFIHCSRIIPRSSMPPRPNGTAWDNADDALEANVHTNSAASIYMMQLAGEQMIKQRSGSIVAFGSMMGLIGVEKHNYDGNPNMAGGAYAHSYSVDKSGLSAWIRHAASYYGQYGVRVNAVCPGGLQSDRTNPVFAQEYSKHTQLGRLANQEDVSGLILLLASDAGAYLTGLNIPIDGGYTAI